MTKHLCQFALLRSRIIESTCPRCAQRHFSESAPEKIRRPCARGGDCKMELARRGLNEYRCSVCGTVVYDRKVPQRQCGAATPAEVVAGAKPPVKPAVTVSHGPGTEAKALLRSLAITPLPGCDCDGYAAMMDAWGADGCREHFDEIVAHFREYAGMYGWAAKLKAAALAVTTGLAFRLDPLDPIPDLIREAIRRAEAKGGRRLAILTPILGYGGTERWTVELIQAIRDEWSVEVGVLVVDDQSPQGAVEAIRELCPVSFLTLKQFPAWCQQFDAIKAWGLMQLPAMVEGYTGPVIATSHGEDLVWTKRWVDYSKKAVTHWTAVSQAAVAPLAAARVSPDKITVIYNAVDAERCKPTRPREEVRAALGFRPWEYVVGYLGRLGQEKRVPVIADTVGVLGGDYRGLIVGDGNQRSKLNWHGGRVKIIPHTFEIGNMLSAMDCLVGLCDHEGFWRVGIEAAIAGVPLVSTRVGILREIADEHGVLWEEVPAGIDAAGVAQSVQRLRAAGGEPARTARMRAVALTYSMERFGHAWKELLRTLAKG